MVDKNYELHLYKPSGEYKGILMVDNLEVNLNLQDMSSISFDIPEKINGEYNIRIDEVLDLYEVELHYGNLDGVQDLDFQRYRFVIYQTPLDFQQYNYRHTYLGLSVESKLMAQTIQSWEGILKKTYFKLFDLKEISTSGTIYQDVNNQKYITVKINNSVNEEDLEIYELREEDTGVEVVRNFSALIPFDSEAPLSFRRGYYTLRTNASGLFADIAIDNSYNTIIDDDFNIFFLVYDNPTGRLYNVGYSGLLRDFIMENENSAIAAGTQDISVDGETITYNVEEYYSKDGLKMQEVLNSILENTDFTAFVDDSNSENPDALINLYRSNFTFNNSTIYDAAKSIAEAFDAIMVVDTINKELQFYKDLEFGEDSGLIVQYGSYLKDIQKSIDASKVATALSALGKDNLGLGSITPTGDGYWEDYSYYLDDFSPQLSNENITVNLSSPTFTISFDTGFESNMQSRWMSTEMAQSLFDWQLNRDFYHGLMYGSDVFFGIEIENPESYDFYNLYNIRKELIEVLTKKESSYDAWVIKRDTYKTLYEYRLSELEGIEDTQSQEYLDAEESRDKYYDLYIGYREQTLYYFQNEILPLQEELEDIQDIFSTVAGLLNKDIFFNKYRGARSLASMQQEYKNFRKEYIFTDNTCDNEFDLLKNTIAYMEENGRPKITLDLNIIDILSSDETANDRKKLKIGSKLNIYFPRFNIDELAQIKEITINFQANSISLVISTIKRYSKNLTANFLNTIKKLTINNNNLVKYNKDPNAYAAENAQSVANTLNTGISAGSTPILGGIQTADGQYPISLTAEGLTGFKVELDDRTETIRIQQEADIPELRFSNGGIVARGQKRKIEMSVDNGFYIATRSNSNLPFVKRFSVSPEGDIIFSGKILQSSTIETVAGDFLSDDLLKFELNITGGNRSILYNASAGSPSPSTGGIFTANPTIGLSSINDLSGVTVTYAWSVGGSFITNAANSLQSFQPGVNSTLQSESTYVELVGTFRLNGDPIKIITERVPILVTRIGDTGTGAAGVNARTIKLIPNKYVINYDELNSEDSQITFTTETRGTASGSTLEYEFFINSQDPPAQAKSGTSDFTLPENDEPGKPGNENQVLVSVALYEDDELVAGDSVSIFAVRNGSDAITLVNDNQAHTMISDFDGTNTIYTGSGTNIILYQGDIMLDYDEVGTDNGTWKLVASSTNITNGSISVEPSGGSAYALVADHDDMTDNIAKIEYTITGKDLAGAAINLITSQSFTKSLAGQPGEAGDDAIVIRITPSSQAVTLNADGNTSSLQIITFDTDVQGSPSALTWEASANTGVFNSSNGTITFQNNTAYTFPMVVIYGDGTHQDTVTIYGIKPGADGDNGEDSVVGFLTNESHVVAALSTGLGYSITGGVLTGAGGTFKVFDGLSDVTTSGPVYSVVGSSTISGLTISINSSTGVYSLSGASWTSDQAVFTLRAAYNGLNIDKVYTISKSKQGNTGATGATGAGVVFRGEWNSTSEYFSTATRRDVVFYDINPSFKYWISTNGNSINFAPPSSGSTSNDKWVSFGATFSSVATDILFANDVYADRTINIGSNGGTPVIALNSDASSGWGNPYISIGSTTYDTLGVFLGYHSNTPKFSLKSATNSLLWNGSVLSVTGTVNSSSGSIGGWSLSSNSLSATNALIKTSPNAEILLGRNAGTMSQFTFPYELGSVMGLVGSSSGVLGIAETYSKSGSAPFAPNGVQRFAMGSDGSNRSFYIQTFGGLPGEGLGNDMLKIRGYSKVLLHSDTDYVYASRGTESTTNGARITVGTLGVSTKIVKKDINSLDYNDIDNFLETIEPKKFTNIMKNKEKISLIIEDEQDKNLPFSNILFKREDKLFSFSELPDYLKPYEDDENTIQKKFKEDGEILSYFFSPLVIDEQTLNGLLIASVKYNHNRIKQLEQEVAELKNLVQELINNKS